MKFDNFSLISIFISLIFFISTFSTNFLCYINHFQEMIIIIGFLSIPLFVITIILFKKIQTKHSDIIVDMILVMFLIIFYIFILSIYLTKSKYIYVIFILCFMSSYVFLKISPEKNHQQTNFHKNGLLEIRCPHCGSYFYKEENSEAIFKCNNCQKKLKY